MPIGRFGWDSRKKSAKDIWQPIHWRRVRLFCCSLRAPTWSVTREIQIQQNEGKATQKPRSFFFASRMTSNLSSILTWSVWIWLTCVQISFPNISPVVSMTFFVFLLPPLLQMWPEQTQKNEDSRRGPSLIATHRSLQCWQAQFLSTFPLLSKAHNKTSTAFGLEMFGVFSRFDKVGSSVMQISPKRLWR